MLWHGEMMRTILNGCQTKMASLLPGLLVAEMFAQKFNKRFAFEVAGRFHAVNINPLPTQTMLGSEKGIRLCWGYNFHKSLVLTISFYTKLNTSSFTKCK